jgi:hypothetical protein
MSKYVDKKIKEGNFVYAYIASKKENTELSERTLSKWYNLMDSKMEMLSVAKRFNDNKLARYVLEKALKDNQ